MGKKGKLFLTEYQILNTEGAKKEKKKYTF